MVNLLIIASIIIVLLVFISFKWNNLRTKITFFFILVGIGLVALTAYLIISGKEINLTTVNGVTSTIKVYVSWFSNAGSNIAKITTYALKQDWGGRTITNSSES